MAAILLGTAGLSFGFLNTETGGLLEKLEIQLKRETKVVTDNVGAITGKAYFNPTEDISFDFWPTGSTGMSAASPGVVLTLANYTPTAGGIYTEEVSKSRPNNDYWKHSVKAMVHPLIS